LEESFSHLQELWKPNGKAMIIKANMGGGGTSFHLGHSDMQQHCCHEVSARSCGEMPCCAVWQQISPCLQTLWTGASGEYFKEKWMSDGSR